MALFVFYPHDFALSLQVLRLDPRSYTQTFSRRTSFKQTFLKNLNHAQSLRTTQPSDNSHIRSYVPTSLARDPREAQT